MIGGAANTLDIPCR